MFPLHFHPQGSTGSSTFLVSNESPYISHYKPKTSASNSLYFQLEVVAENVPISGTPILIFFMYFHNSLISSVISGKMGHILIFATAEKIKINLEVKLCKMCLRGQGQLV